MLKDLNKDLLVEIYCDHDGTITTADTTDLLLERLADPAWHSIEEQWEAGKIDSRQCMSEQIRLIRGGWTAIVEVLQEVEIDPTFPSFLNWCHQINVPVTIASDGIDRVIEHLLARYNLTVSAIFANQLLESDDGNLCLASPYGKDDCPVAVCKCRLMTAKNSTVFRVVIGDGRSDFCWASEADLLFAKSKLARYCQEREISFYAFDNFHSVKSILQEKLAQLSWLEPSLA